MSEPRSRTCTDPECFAEDVAIEALLAMERAWAKAHRGGELPPDMWGEGPSRLRLADLGLDTRLRSNSMIGVCSVHGEFSFDWTGLRHEQPPQVSWCTATSGGQRCSLRGLATKSADQGPLPK